MSTDSAIEKRLTDVENSLAEIQGKLSGLSPSSDWLGRFRGAFREEPAFLEVVELVQEHRKADRPEQERDIGQ